MLMHIFYIDSGHALQLRLRLTPDACHEYLIAGCVHRRVRTVTRLFSLVALIRLAFTSDSDVIAIPFFFFFFPFFFFLFVVPR